MISPLDTTVTLPALRTLAGRAAEKTDTLRHLASGVRVSLGKDDPADLISGENLRAQRTANRVNVDNATAAVAATDIAERALGEVQDHLNRLNQLVIASSDDAVSKSERQANQVETDELLARIEAVLHGTEFKGTPLFRGRPADTSLPPMEGIQGEVGKMLVDQPVPDVTRRVTFAEPIPDPIVIAGALTDNESSDMANIRITNVDTNGFDFYIEEFEHKDGIHAAETFNWFALPRGNWTLDDGTKLFVGSRSVSTAVTTVNFGGAFQAPPVVLTSAQTANDPRAVFVRQDVNLLDPGRQPAVNNTRLYLQGGEQHGGAHGAETVGYVAIQAPNHGPGSGSGFGEINPDGVVYETRRTNQTTTDAYSTIAYAGRTDPVFVAQSAGASGNNPSGTRVRNIGSAGAEMRIGEEDWDGETTHIPEPMAFVVFDEPGQIRQYQPPPAPSADDLAGSLPDDPDTLVQSSLTFDLGDGKRFGLAALRFEDTTLASLGDGTNSLAGLATGGPLALDGDRPTSLLAEDAQKAIEGAREQINTMRNRAGRFRRWTVDPVLEGLREQGVQLADAFSQTADTDFAQATAELTRLGILEQATADVLRAAGDAQRIALALLPGA